jgi:hypothetical protein
MFGPQQVSDSRWAARSIRCGAYSNRPRLAPKRLTGSAIPAVQHDPFGAGPIAIARGLRPSGSRGGSTYR